MLELQRTSPPGANLRFIPFDLPDVIYALPDDATRRALAAISAPAEKRFPGWRELAERYRAARAQPRSDGNPPDPKEHALRTELGISKPATAVVKRILRECDTNAGVAPALARALDRVLAETSDQPM